MQGGVEKALVAHVMESQGCGEAAGFAAGKVGLGQRVRHLKGEWSLLLWVIRFGQNLTHDPECVLEKNNNKHSSLT